MKPASELVGQVFGRLTVKHRIYPNRRGGNTVWHCECECGNTKDAVAAQLRAGRTQSCGCLRLDRNLEAVVTHGKSKTRVYKIWFGMTARCRNPEHKNFDRYGARGIYVCDRWHKFENFMSDMGEPPPKSTLERMDNDGPYSPDNCCWTSRKEQSRNTSVNIIVEFNGRKMSLPEACELSGLRYGSVYMRMRRGMPFDDAISVNVGRIRL